MFANNKNKNVPYGWFNHETNSYQMFPQEFLNNTISSYGFIFVPYNCFMRYISIDDAMKYLSDKQSYEIILISGDSMMNNFANYIRMVLEDKVNVIDSTPIVDLECDFICQLKKSVYNESKIPLIIKQSFPNVITKLENSNQSNIAIANKIDLIIENFNNIHLTWY